VPKGRDVHLEHKGVHRRGEAVVCDGTGEGGGGIATHEEGAGDSDTTSGR
jgi:hypothetical protein